MREIEIARQTYEKIIANDPGRENIYTLLGDIYFQKEDWADCERVYRKCLERFPASLSCHFFLGKTYMRQKRYDIAESEFREVLKLEPELIELEGLCE